MKVRSLILPPPPPPPAAPPVDPRKLVHGGLRPYAPNGQFPNETHAQDELCAFAAGLCRLAYRPISKAGFTDDAARFLADEGATSADAMRESGTQILVAMLDGRAWIAFRGTVTRFDFSGLGDWGANFSVQYGHHAGFWRRYRRIRPLMIAWLEANQADIRGLVITGHSLGGAIATLAAQEIARSGNYPLEAVVTFASPRVLGPWKARDYNKLAVSLVDRQAKLGDITYRIVSDTDLVTWVPFSLLGFRHVAKPRKVGAIALASNDDLNASQGWHTPTAPKYADRVTHILHNASQKSSSNPLITVLLVLDWLRLRENEHRMQVYAQAFAGRASFSQVPPANEPELGFGRVLSRYDYDNEADGLEQLHDCAVVAPLVLLAAILIPLAVWKMFGAEGLSFFAPFAAMALYQSWSEYR